MESPSAQKISDRLDAFAVESFFEKWLGRLALRVEYRKRVLDDLVADARLIA